MFIFVVKFHLDVSTYFFTCSLYWTLTNLFLFEDMFHIALEYFLVLFHCLFSIFLFFSPLELLIGCWIVWIDHLCHICFHIFFMSLSFTFFCKGFWVCLHLCKKKKKDILEDAFSNAFYFLIFS